MDIYALLSHPMRRKILRLLEKKGFLRHSDLMENLRLSSTGKLNFHLSKMENLVKKDPHTSAYYLSEEGKQVIYLLNLNEKILRGDDLPFITAMEMNVNRIGVIICKCAGELSQVVDTKILANHIRKVADVVSVLVLDTLCQEKHRKEVQDWCKEHYINKIVIAACSPKTHRHIFEAHLAGTIERQYLEVANLREQCVWVHGEYDGKDMIQRKAQLLVEAAIERVKIQKGITTQTVKVLKSVAIIGAGVGGMNLALKLAKTNIKVYLIEKSPTLGGKAARWNKISGIADCSICFISELIAGIIANENITVFTNAEITKVDGHVGHFVITITQHPRYVDVEKCNGCGRCSQICQLNKPNPLDFGLSSRKRIFIPYVNAYPFAAVIEEDTIDECRTCRICERACPSHAINLDEVPKQIKLNVGAKVIAVGTDLPQNNWSNPDIIMNYQLERLISNEGITGGAILKRSDGRSPRSIGIIHQAIISGFKRPTKREKKLLETLLQKYIHSLKEQLHDVPIYVYTSDPDLPKLPGIS
ncbi:MAG: DUF7347 domain-containing protein, partial [Promethearchaeota archaeon]